MDGKEMTPDTQRLAFRFLRSNAVSAHFAGDGLLVNLLCSTGLDQARRLADSQLLLLQITELVWLPIFAFYWLVSPIERLIIDQTVKQIPGTDSEDVLIREWLGIHNYLIEQPMSGGPELLGKLVALNWPAFFLQYSVEVETLVTHLIELVWFRAPSDGLWEDLAEAWEKSGPRWAVRTIQALRKRLGLQTRLTVPGQKYRFLPESARDELRSHSDLAELWLLDLHGRSKEVCAAVEQITADVSGDSHKWRVVGDFANLNGDSARDPESESVHLARRRRLSVEIGRAHV